jgi:hypothetical protein
MPAPIQASRYPPVNPASRRTRQERTDRWYIEATGATEEKGAEWPFLPVLSNCSPKAFTREAVALAMVRVELAGWNIPGQLLHRPLGSLWRHEILDRNVHLIADPDPMASAVLDVLDGGDLDPEHLADQRRQHGHGTAELAGENRPQLPGLLLGRSRTHEEPDPPVAIGHQWWGVGQHGDRQVAHIDVLDRARIDVEDQHDPAPIVVGRHGQPRGGAGAHRTRVQTVRWAITGFIISALALMVLAWGPDEPSTTDPSVSMTMAFAVVAFSAVNLGLVLRREREAFWSPPIFPYLGWIIAGWALTWAAVELNMLQRLLDTVQLTGAQWALVLALSLVAPAFTAIDKAIQLRRLNRSPHDA